MRFVGARRSATSPTGCWSWRSPSVWHAAAALPTGCGSAHIKADPHPIAAHFLYWVQIV